MGQSDFSAVRNQVDHRVQTHAGSEQFWPRLSMPMGISAPVTIQEATFVPVSTRLHTTRLPSLRSAKPRSSWTPDATVWRSFVLAQYSANILVGWKVGVWRKGYDVSDIYLTRMPVWVVMDDSMYRDSLAPEFFAFLN